MPDAKRLSVSSVGETGVGDMETDLFLQRDKSMHVLVELID